MRNIHSCSSFRHLDGGFVMLSEALHPIPQMEPLPPNLAAQRGFWNPMIHPSGFIARPNYRYAADRAAV
ncbi:hypothetical protein ILYODFUR_009047 [Ilyodon furcidens]|uniref:Uncharacterized protein n=1 Tax=Ilyodon furcidens TaxID=33524 RepID=A0ABV0U3T3_9TELE